MGEAHPTREGSSRSNRSKNITHLATSEEVVQGARGRVKPMVSQQLQTPTWMKNAIKAIWLNWRHIPGVDPGKRSSAINISEFLRETLQKAGINVQPPEVRTVQRVIAEFRELWDAAQDMADEASVPFGDGWTKDSDDTAYLLALIRYWGEEFHPDLWGSLSISYRPSSGETDNEIDDKTHDIPPDNETANMEHEDDDLKTNAKLKLTRRESILPFSKKEIGVALQLKGAFGWPDDFEEHSGTRRKPWELSYPLYNLPVPGEIALIKEIAIRTEHSKLSGSSYGGTDIFGILLDRPWSENNASERMRPGGPPWTRKLRHDYSSTSLWRSHVMWKPSALRWDSIYTAGRDLDAPRDLRAAIDRYIITGDDDSSMEARRILNDLYPPAEIDRLITDRFERIDVLEKPEDRPQLSNVFWHSSGLRQADGYLRFVESHIIHVNREVSEAEEGEQDDRLNFPDRGLDLRHGPQLKLRIEDPNNTNSPKIWISLSANQMSLLAPGQSRRSRGEVYCAGCEKFYMDPQDIWSVIIDRETLTSDIDLVKLTFEAVLETGYYARLMNLVNSPHTLEFPFLDLLKRRMEEKYSPDNPNYEESHKLVGEYLESVVVELRQYPSKYVEPISSASEPGRLEERGKTPTLNLADRIRRFVIEHFIEPKIKQGHTSVTVRAGDVAASMQLSNRMPSICSAMRGRRIQEMAGVQISPLRSPNPGANFSVEYLLPNNEEGQVTA